MEKVYLMQKKKKNEATKKYKYNKNIKNYVQERKSINIGKESLDISPQTWDQSNKVPKYKARSWFPEVFTSKYTTSNTIVSNSKC